MKKMLWQISDASLKVTVVSAWLKEEVVLSSVRFYNWSGWAAVVTVYVSASDATSDATNVIYYNAALADNGVIELTGLALWNGQKLEVLTDVTSGLVVTAFWEKVSSYA